MLVAFIRISSASAAIHTRLSTIVNVGSSASATFMKKNEAPQRSDSKISMPHSSEFIGELCFIGIYFS